MSSTQNKILLRSYARGRGLSLFLLYFYQLNRIFLINVILYIDIYLNM